MSFKANSDRVALTRTVSQAGAESLVLERGFICIKGWEVRLADLISFFLNIP